MPLQFLVHLVRHKADAYVSLYSSGIEVEHRAHLQCAFRDPERPLHYPQPVILLYYLAWGEVCVGDVPLEPVPACVLGNLLLADLNRHILAYLKELVVASAVDLRLGQGSALVGLAQPLYAALAVVGILVGALL